MFSKGAVKSGKVDSNWGSQVVQVEIHVFGGIQGSKGFLVLTGCSIIDYTITAILRAL